MSDAHDEAKRIEKIRAEVIETLQQAAEWSDIENAHSTADDMLCLLLKALGYSDVVEAFDKVEKWYA